MVSEKFGEFCLRNKLILVTAESCTAGMIAALVADTPGSSAWLDRGYVTYSVASKVHVLGVPMATIDKHDITSEEVARAMAQGALPKSRANMAIAVTGVSGPTGGTDKIPVGTICFAWAFLHDKDFLLFSEKVVFSGDRNSIRRQAAIYALEKAMATYPSSVSP